MVVIVVLAGVIKPAFNCVKYSSTYSVPIYALSFPSPAKTVIEGATVRHNISETICNYVKLVANSFIPTLASLPLNIKNTFQLNLFILPFLMQ